MAEATQAAQGLTRWHIVKDAHRSVCGSFISLEFVPAMHVPVEKRCRASACRGRWPSYRARGDNTIMRFQSDAGEKQA